MANKTVYFSTDDTKFIDDALPHLGMSLSQALFQGFQLLVKKHQAQQQNFSEIKLSVANLGFSSIKFSGVGSSIRCKCRARTRR